MNNGMPQLSDYIVDSCLLCVNAFVWLHKNDVNNSNFWALVFGIRNFCDMIWTISLAFPKMINKVTGDLGFPQDVKQTLSCIISLYEAQTHVEPWIEQHEMQKSPDCLYTQAFDNITLVR